MERHIGFFGTNKGLTPEQQTQLHHLLQRASDRLRAQEMTGWLEHPDLRGAPIDANSLGKHVGLKTSVHPCENPTLRANLVRPDRRNPERPYHECGKAVVDASEWLIAAPSESKEDPYSGTWQTVRYARQKHVPVTFVFPDGTVYSERD